MTLNLKGALRSILLPALLVAVLFSACSKDDHQDNNENNASNYSAEVIEKWMVMQQRLMKNAVGIPNHSLGRQFAYSGIAALESMSPGLKPNYMMLRKWNGISGLPHAQGGTEYHYPSSANAALAEINRLMFPNANAADKAAIDSLEHALKVGFLETQTATIVHQSGDFGKAVAVAVYNWSESDGYKNTTPYTIPVGPGLWKPTPPANANPATPYWGLNRPVIKHSTDNTMPPPPPLYSTEPGRPFYEMVKEVYTASQNLTTDQKEMAIFWRDVPGTTTPGHWLSILRQVINQTDAPLDKAALAYALCGGALNDAFISVFKAKYHYNLVRPITYIREVMEIGNWNSFIGTPAHPEYPSAHSSCSAAIAGAMEKLFGNNIGTFTDHTYDYLGLPARTYSTLTSIGDEAGRSRLYAGIHYSMSIDEGLKQGKKVANNIFKN